MNSHNDTTTTTSTHASTARRLAISTGVFLGGVIIAAGAAACGSEEGSGDIATLTLSNAGATEVTAVTVLDDIDVRVNVDPNATQRATLRVDDNLVDNIDAWIDDDGELFVGWVDYVVDVEPSQQPLLILDLQQLDAVENRADGTVTVSGVDEAELDIENEGDGSVDVLA